MYIVTTTNSLSRFFEKFEQAIARRNRLVFWSLMLLLSVAYYHEMLFKLPYGIHFWAQGDRLSLALNFYDDLSSFFLPKTHHSGPIDRVVGVEFPIQAYLAALLAQPFGEQAVSPIFRLLDIALGLSGMYALFLIGLRYMRSSLSALFAPLFIWTSPVFVFYTGGYQPDTAAVSLIFIAAFLMLRFWEKGSPVDAFGILFILSLAMLVKMSTGAYWMSGLGLTGIAWLRHKKLKSPLFGLFCLCTLAFAFGIYAYYQHIQYLNNHYQSKVFLSTPIPLKGSLSEILIFTNSVWKRWSLHYFTQVHYIWILVGLVLSIIFIIARRSFSAIWMLWGFSWLCSGLLIYLLMGPQFHEHDYYANATLMPFAAWLALSVGLNMDKYRQTPLPLVAFIGLLSSLFFYFPKQAERAPYPKHVWLMNADFSDNPIPKGSKILMEGADVPGITPNTALVYINRPGISFGITDFGSKTPLSLAQDLLAIDAEYLVIGRQYATYLDSLYPCFKNLMPVFADKKDYRVHRLGQQELAPNWKKETLSETPTWTLGYDKALQCLFAGRGDYPAIGSNTSRWNTLFKYKLTENELQQSDSLVFEFAYLAPEWSEGQNIHLYFNFYSDKDTLMYIEKLPIIQSSNNEKRHFRIAHPFPESPSKFEVEVFLDNYNGRSLYLEAQRIEFR